jgi:hypothetical protein
MSEVYRLADVKGLTPAVDPTRSGEQFVLNGDNYIFDAIGPKSAFGNRLLLSHKLVDCEQVQGVRLKLRSGDRVFTFTTKGILEWREDLGGWRVVYVTDDTSSQPYRWTYGFLSGVMYFCRPQVGIIAYGLDSDQAFVLNTEGTPTDALAICVDNGRLLAVTPEFLFWSDPSDGTNFEPKLGGAGFQKLAARVPGYPIMVTSYARGVLTWTTGGVLRSEYTGDQEVYRHRALNTEYRPINSFCIFKQDDNTVVILDERGLFASAGEAPQPFAQLFNEFLIGFLQENQLNLEDNVGLEWDELQRLLYLSFSFSRYDPLYEKSFVLYPPTQKWGQFNESHYGILPFRIGSGDRLDDYFGFVDAERRARVWLPTGSRESVPSNRTTDLHYPTIQKPFHYLGGDEGTVLSSSLTLGTIPAKAGRAGYYLTNANAVLAPSLMPLNARVQIGLFRSTKEMSHDELSEITQVLVRSNATGPTTRSADNYSLAPPPAQDFNNPDESAYYGFQEINYVNHSLTILPTVDGVTMFGEPVTPVVVGFSKAARHYSCSAVGIWHIIEVGAGEVGEAFHLRTLELTAVSAGRLL